MVSSREKFALSLEMYWKIIKRDHSQTTLTSKREVELNTYLKYQHYFISFYIKIENLSTKGESFQRGGGMKNYQKPVNVACEWP